MPEYIYPVYMHVEGTTVVLWTSVEKLRGTTVTSIAELHSLELPFGVVRGVPVG